MKHPPVPPSHSMNQNTLRTMVALFCQAHHHPEAELCSECSELLAYACERLKKCPYGDKKPPCSQCPIQCYQPAMRQRIRAVMRFAGPRMAAAAPGEKPRQRPR